jgi:PTH1 family peptidyl-tRNA hydrolase
MESVYLIVGLGNPGRRYDRTRHNVGFMLVERLAERHRAAWRSAAKFEARVAAWDAVPRRVWLCEPLTYMNDSGSAVRRVMDYHKVPQERLLIVVDDADLPLGSLRLKPDGGTGGHHGLESVQEHLGSNVYARLRLGIGRAVGAREITGHVLGRFDQGEADLLEAVLERACDQVECWIAHGARTAMNDFNGTLERSHDEGKTQ